MAKRRTPAAPTPPVIPEPDDTRFGRRLKTLRKRRGLSQVELAQRLGIHPPPISQYECGSLRLHGALLVRLAHALQTTADEILATETTAGAEELPVVDRRFLRRLKHVDKLSRHQQRNLLERSPVPGQEPTAMSAVSCRRIFWFLDRDRGSYAATLQG